jgi:putative endonuclease
VNLFKRILHSFAPSKAINTGQAGEAAAERHLREHGYRIVERNWRCSFGEIDLVATNENTLVFVEVKASRTRGYIAPEWRVHRDKQEKMRSLARYYMKSRATDQPCRFDVIVVWWAEGRAVIDHIEGAF